MHVRMLKGLVAFGELHFGFLVECSEVAVYKGCLLKTLDPNVVVLVSPTVVFPYGDLLIILVIVFIIIVVFIPLYYEFIQILHVLLQKNEFFHLLHWEWFLSIWILPLLCLLLQMRLKLRDIDVVVQQKSTIYIVEHPTPILQLLGVLYLFPFSLVRAFLLLSIVQPTQKFVLALIIFAISQYLFKLWPT